MPNPWSLKHPNLKFHKVVSYLNFHSKPSTWSLGFHPACPSSPSKSRQKIVLQPLSSCKLISRHKILSCVEANLQYYISKEQKTKSIPDSRWMLFWTVKRSLADKLNIGSAWPTSDGLSFGLLSTLIGLGILEPSPNDASAAIRDGNFFWTWYPISPQW